MRRAASASPEMVATTFRRLQERRGRVLAFCRGRVGAKTSIARGLAGARLDEHQLVIRGTKAGKGQLVNGILGTVR